MCKLAFEKLCVEAALFNKLRVASLLHNITVLHHTGVTLPQGQTPSANAMWQDLKSRYSDYDNENNWDGNAYGTFYWEARSWGNDSHHFSIASEGDWHKENLS